MTRDLRMTVTLHEACHALDVGRHAVVEIVEAGVVDPLPAGQAQATSPEDWLFDADMLSRMQRARRLCRELELDLAAVALVLDLLAEKERLQHENRQLRRRLQRFVEL